MCDMLSEIVDFGNGTPNLFCAWFLPGQKPAKLGGCKFAPVNSELSEMGYITHGGAEVDAAADDDAAAVGAGGKAEDGAGGAKETMVLVAREAMVLVCGMVARNTMVLVARDSMVLVSRETMVLVARETMVVVVATL